MGVSEETRSHRVTSLENFVYSVLLAIPFLGVLVGFFIVLRLAARIFLESRHRLADLFLLLLFTVLYFVVMAITWPRDSNDFHYLVVAEFALCLIGLTVIHKRIAS